MDGDAFEPPSPAVESGVGGRQWSSLKSSASPPAATEEDRERAKSLPAYGLTVTVLSSLFILFQSLHGRLIQQELHLRMLTRFTHCFYTFEVCSVNKNQSQQFTWIHVSNSIWSFSGFHFNNQGYGFQSMKPDAKYIFKLVCRHDEKLAVNSLQTLKAFF